MSRLISALIVAFFTGQACAANVDPALYPLPSLPLCNDSKVINLAERGVEQGPLKLKVLILTNVRQTAYNAAADKRSCEGTAWTNFGKRDLKFTVEWIDKVLRHKIYVSDQGIKPITGEQAMILNDD